MDLEPEPPVSVPHAQIAADALRGLIEAFVLREGTEYGAEDISIERKVAQVMRQLEAGTAEVVFDPNEQSVNIVPVDAGVRRR